MREENSQTAGNMAAARSLPHPEPGPAVHLNPRQEQKHATIIDCRPNIRGENRPWTVTAREADRCFSSCPLQVQLCGDTGVATDRGVSTPITGEFVFSHVSLPRGVLGRRVSKQPVRGGDVCFSVPAGGLMGVERGHGRLRIPSGGLTGGAWPPQTPQIAGSTTALSITLRERVYPLQRTTLIKRG